jgi:uncharacterized membrane protein YczE
MQTSPQRSPLNKRRLIGWLKPTYSGQQYLLYLAGCLMFSVGADFFIASQLGTDPLDVFALGLMNHLPITVGIAQSGFALICLFIWALWNKKLPPISPFVTFFLCGSLIDVWMWVRLDQYMPLGAYPVMLVGVLLCAYGSSYIIMSGIGIRAMDLVAITMTMRWRLPFWAAKGVMEVILLALGWWWGGPVGVGTLCFLVFVGWMIQPLMVANEKVLRIPNHGLKRSPLHEVVLT